MRWIFHDFRQTRGDQPDPLQPPVHRIRMRIFRFVIEHAFHTVDQRVQRSGDRQFFRHGQREFRIDERDLGDDRLFHDQFFDTRVMVDDVRVRRGFRAGSRRGRNADDAFELFVRELFRGTVDAKKLLHIQSGLHAQISGFGGIHDAPAADRDNFFRLVFSDDFTHAADVFDRRLGRNARQIHRRDAVAAEFLHHKRQAAVRGSGTGPPAEDQSVGHLFFEQISSQRFDSAGAETNRGVRIFVQHTFITEFSFGKFRHFFSFAACDRRKAITSSMICSSSISGSQPHNSLIAEQSGARFSMSSKPGSYAFS